MTEVYSTALEGIRNAQERLDRAARNIARGSSFNEVQDKTSSSDDVLQISPKGYQFSSATPPAGVDYATEFVSVLEARSALKANLKVAATQNELDNEILDLLA